MLKKMLAKTKLLALLVLLTLVPDGKTQDLNQPCTNPNGDLGRCVFLRECRPLLEIYKKNNVSFSESEFFYGSRCTGKSNGKSLVCCSPPPSMASKVLPRPPADCGLSSPDRIFGGNETELGEFSWTALLVYTYLEGTVSLDCGASLINSRYVVTAAHCIPKGKADYTLTAVRLGEHNITNDELDCDQYKNCADVPVDVGIEKVIVHEEYDATQRSQYNDIALIRLDRDVGFSDYISPVCLPIEESERQMNHTGRKTWVAGWGLTEFNDTSEVKLKVALDVVNHEECASLYKQAAKMALRDTQLCAGGKQGKDSCWGDSGGPLMRLIQGNYYLVGVVSFGPTNCGTKNVPGVYTNVATFIDWIQNNLE